MKAIKIAEKEYKLHYGLDFIAEMDRRYPIEIQNGAKIGAGIQLAVVYLQQKNPVVIRDIILSATNTLNSVPSKKDIELWLEENIENLDGICESFLESLKDAPMTKKQVMSIVEALEI